MKQLARGQRGDEVSRLQALLCLARFDAKPIDGIFGRGTEAIVKDYQRAKNLPVNGQVDEDCQRALGLDQPDETKVPTPVIDALTVDKVARMFSRHTPRRNIERFLPPVLAALREAEMDDRELVLMALSTIRAESEGFEPIDEQVSRYNTSDGGHSFDLYDDRASLGNRGRPDGERFKGRGFVQLTGRSNYEGFSIALGLGSELVDRPERANEPELAARILAAFLKEKRSAAKYAILGRDLRTARKLVNGGSHGLDRFEDAFRTGEQLLA